MRLFVSQAMPTKVEAALSARFECTFRGDGPPLTLAQAQSALTNFDAILPTLGDNFSAEAFARPARTKIIANFGVGVNHIDVAAARKAGLEVTNTPGAVTDATADIGMMLLLMAARRASEGEALVRAGRWHGWRPTQLLGLHLSGKTLGIVGMGRIGKAVAQRAHHGFGMKIAYYSRSKTDVGLPATRIEDLHELLGQVDAVILTVPATADTRYMIDAAALAAMQPHAVLVNIARGDVMDEGALISALARRKIAGAGLDVYENEPRVPEALRTLPNVSLMPHLGTSALEVREAMGMMAYDNLVAFAEGRPVPNPA